MKLQPGLSLAGQSRTLGLHRAAITLLLMVAFFWSFFHRMGMAVIAPEMETSFGLSAVSLGLLGAAYFYPYSVAQLPVGVLVDTVGPRWVLTAFVTMSAVGSLLFSWSGSFEQAVTGRLLVGLGSGAVYLASTRLFVNWYHPRQFATLSGLLSAVGNVGGLCASLPLSVVVAALGWRQVFSLVTALMLGLVVMIFAILRDQPPSGFAPVAPKQASEASRPPQLSFRQSLRKVASNAQLWILALALFPYVGTRFGFQSLWAGPYLSEIRHLTPAEVGGLLMLMSLAVALFSPVVGYLSDRVFRSRKGFSLVGFTLYALCWVPLAIAPDSVPTALLYPLLIGLGVFSCFWISVFAQAKELFPPLVAGTVLAVVNFASIFGGAVYQQLMGMVIDLFGQGGQGYSARAYAAAFGFCLASSVVSALLVAVSREADKR